MYADERVLRSFGRELRRLRIEADLTQEAVAHRVSQRGTSVSNSHVSDIENGRAMARPWLRKFLDEVLESDGRLEKLWEELTGSGRQVWLHEVTKRTHAADALFEYQPLVFPSYVQTERYAHALIRYGSPWLSSKEVDTIAKGRCERADRMVEAELPSIWLIIDQGVPEAVKPVETFYAAGSPRSELVCSSSGRGGLMWTTSGNAGGTGTEANRCGWVA